MTKLIVFLIHVYRWTLKPFLHVLSGGMGGCRYEPGCSQYCLEAVQRHGAGKGLWLGICRIGRCHPWGGSGYDPVPDATDLRKEGTAPPLIERKERCGNSQRSTLNAQLS